MKLLRTYIYRAGPVQISPKFFFKLIFVKSYKSWELRLRLASLVGKLFISIKVNLVHLGVHDLKQILVMLLNLRPHHLLFLFLWLLFEQIWRCLFWRPWRWILFIGIVVNHNFSFLRNFGWLLHFGHVTTSAHFQFARWLYRWFLVLHFLQLSIEDAWLRPSQFF